VAASTASSPDIFEGPGEVRALCRALDWSRTSLGPPDSWAATLRIAVRTALDSPFPLNLWCGPDLVLIYNDAYVSVLGSKHPAALGARGADVWREIWPQIEPMFDAMVAGGEPIYAEDSPFVVQRDREEASASAPNAWFTFALSPVRDEEGAVVAFLNVVSETTRRVQAERAREEALRAAEQAEARLRDVFAQAPSFLAVLRGSDHVFEYVNDAYYQLVGHRPLLGRPVFEAMPEVRGQGFEELLDTVVESGRPYIGREVPVMVQRTPGSELEQRFVDLVYYPVAGSAAVAAGVVAHGSDVTEHVLARQEAQRARADAERANDAKSQFLANMSHEIRTPINAVVGYTDLLDTRIAGPLTDRQQDFVARIRSSSRHLIALVDDVLDLSKIEAGEMAVRIEARPAATVVAASVQMIAAEADSRSLQVREAWQCDADAQFLGDEDRVRQIMLNLLSNAIKFTPAGGTITVRCRTADEAPESLMRSSSPHWLVLEVEDTGIGIPPEQQVRIFEAFVQADAGTTRQTGGTGLGLTISRRLARMMGGDLTVRSESNHGSCFSLWMPTPAAAQTMADDPPVSDEPAAHVTVGDMLVEAAELLEDELVWRLQQLHGPDYERLQLADHTAAFVAALGRAITLYDGHPRTAEQQDAVEVRAVISGRHGRQRHRLGWTIDDVDTEYGLLREMLDSFVRREAPQRTNAPLEGALTTMHNLLTIARTNSGAGYEAAQQGVSED